MLATENFSVSERKWNDLYITGLGSDPRLATCRGKLQNQRAKLNQEINKQIMIRNGAERLYKVTANKKLRETVALELSFVNSNLQLLKEQLADLNSSVNIYQNKSSPQVVPMIPLGLKETKEIDFTDIFKDFILEHYSEDSSKYENAIKEFMDIRQAVRTPTRDHNGVKLLFNYYNLLYYIDRRFFPPHRNMGIFFEWFDSLTGVPSTQKTIAFEKASVLFNIAALYTQIAAKQDRTNSSGVDAAVDNFLRAAGMFRYIRDNFSNAPSMDLSSDTLDTLIQLMLAQARECLFEKLTPGVEKLGIQTCLEVAQEAEQVSSVYRTVHKVMSCSSVKDYVPYSWISLLLVKSEHYRALGHHYAAVGLLEHNGEIDKEVESYLEYVHCPDANNSSTCIDIRVPHTTEERRQLGKAHLRASLLLHEEALRLHRMCRQLRQIDNLQERLRTAHDASLDRYARCEQEDDFQEILDAPPIQAATKYQLTLMTPEFSEYTVDDLFHELGPLKVFSARRQWTAARTIHLKKETEENFGFSVRGDAPVMVAAIDSRSIAQEAGMKEGDFIVLIGNAGTKWMNHEEVVHLIRESGHELTLKVVTPIDLDYLHPKSNSSSASSSPASNASTLSSTDLSRVNLRTNSSPFAKDKRRRATWNFFRRSQSKERQFPIINDVVFR
ncbi:rhophilin-2 [Trichonephila inaurata madagascariensis]|uniref:Rhophilin-2 n=1 Tax=Trichonephila inaurata madagascariensis TaxID=2747483 RepID=A0A8X7CGD0_9ARAC|nr:rhophilin-2 [Trichonephila inaurata madagascariensis]